MTEDHEKSLMSSVLEKASHEHSVVSIDTAHRINRGFEITL